MTLQFKGKSQKISDIFKSNSTSNNSCAASPTFSNFNDDVKTQLKLYTPNSIFKKPQHHRRENSIYYDISITAFYEFVSDLREKIMQRAQQPISVSIPFDDQRSMKYFKKRFECVKIKWMHLMDELLHIANIIDEKCKNRKYYDFDAIARDVVNISLSYILFDGDTIVDDINNSTIDDQIRKYLDDLPIILDKINQDYEIMIKFQNTYQDMLKSRDDFHEIIYAENIVRNIINECIEIMDKNETEKIRTLYANTNTDMSGIRDAMLTVLGLEINYYDEKKKDDVKSFIRQCINMLSVNEAKCINNIILDNRNNNNLDASILNSVLLKIGIPNNKSLRICQEFDREKILNFISQHLYRITLDDYKLNHVKSLMKQRVNKINSDKRQEYYSQLRDTKLRLTTYLSNHTQREKQLQSLKNSIDSLRVNIRQQQRQLHDILRFYYLSSDEWCYIQDCKLLPVHFKI